MQIPLLLFYSPRGILALHVNCVFRARSSGLGMNVKVHAKSVAGSLPCLSEGGSGHTRASWLMVIDTRGRKPLELFKVCFHEDRSVFVRCNIQHNCFGI